MTQMFLLVCVLGIIGCASTSGLKQPAKPGAGSKAQCMDEMQGSNVYAALKCLLQNNTTCSDTRMHS